MSDPPTNPTNHVVRIFPYNFQSLQPGSALTIPQLIAAAFNYNNLQPMERDEIEGIIKQHVKKFNRNSLGEALSRYPGLLTRPGEGRQWHYVGRDMVKKKPKTTKPKKPLLYAEVDENDLDLLPEFESEESPPPSTDSRRPDEGGSMQKESHRLYKSRSTSALRVSATLRTDSSPLPQTYPPSTLTTEASCTITFPAPPPPSPEGQQSSAQYNVSARTRAISLQKVPCLAIDGLRSHVGKSRNSHPENLWDDVRGDNHTPISQQLQERASIKPMAVHHEVTTNTPLQHQPGTTSLDTAALEQQTSGSRWARYIPVDPANGLPVHRPQTACDRRVPPVLGLSAIYINPPAPFCAPLAIAATTGIDVLPINYPNRPDKGLELLLTSASAARAPIRPVGYTANLGASESEGHLRLETSIERPDFDSEATDHPADMDVIQAAPLAPETPTGVEKPPFLWPPLVFDMSASGGTIPFSEFAANDDFTQGHTAFDFDPVSFGPPDILWNATNLTKDMTDPPADHAPHSPDSVLILNDSLAPAAPGSVLEGSVTAEASDGPYGLLLAHGDYWQTRSVSHSSASCRKRVLSDVDLDTRDRDVGDLTQPQGNPKRQKQSGAHTLLVSDSHEAPQQPIELEDDHCRRHGIGAEQRTSTPSTTNLPESGPLKETATGSQPLGSTLAGVPSTNGFLDWWTMPGLGKDIIRVSLNLLAGG